MKHRILQTCKLSPAIDAALHHSYDVHELFSEKDAAAFLARHGSEFEGLLTSAQTGASAELIASLPQLRVIVIFGVGLDRTDLESARRRGIQVSNTPDILTDCVADLAFGLVIDIARELSAADRFVRSGQWLNVKYRLSARVSGKRLGIVGLGRIGRAIAKRAIGFDMEIRYYNRSKVEGIDLGREPTVESLSRWADFLVVAVAGGSGTRHLISSAALQELGPRGYLINISRGSVVDEAALVKALSTGGIAGAGLDVFQDEPNVPEALLALDNVVLLPHIGSGTVETRKAMEDLVLANLDAFFTKGKVLSEVF